MTITRRELSKGGAAALVAAAVMPVVADRAPVFTFAGHPLTGLVDGAYIQKPIRANHVSVNEAGELTLVFEAARPDPPPDGEWVWWPDHGGAWVPA